MKTIYDTNLMSTFLLGSELKMDKPFNNTTKKIILGLYDEIVEGYNYLLTLKNKNRLFYNYKIKKNNSIVDITRPVSFSKDSFPVEILQYINEHSLYELTYTFSLFEKNIRFIFILENKDDLDLEAFHRRIDVMIIWLYIATKHSSKKCAQEMTVYIYFTSLKKSIVKNTDNTNILYEKNVNTGFTFSCPKKSEIVIYRKEEFIKVFMHEIYHNFALDFSTMNNAKVNEFILSLFKIKSRVNLFEAYTEFWAEFMNSLLCSFFSIKNKSDPLEFLERANYVINLEVAHSFFQLVKVLDHMGLTYKDLYSNNKSSEERRRLYIEKTHLFSYYIVKTILMNSYQDFLKWCKDNNDNLLDFKKTPQNQMSFCNFIFRKYNTKSMLKGVKQASELLDYVYQFPGRSNKTNHLLYNLRMSLCELSYG